MAKTRVKPAKTRVKPAEIEEEYDDVVDNELEDEDEEQLRVQESLNDTVIRLGGEYGEDLLIKVYRIDSKTKVKGHCFDITPEELPIEQRLRAEYGGGEYVAVIYAPNAQGRKSTVKHVKIMLAEPIKTEHPYNNPAPNFGDAISGLKESLIQMQIQSQQNITEMMKIMMQNKNEGTSLTELVAALQAMKQLSGDGNVLTQVKELLNVTREVQDFNRPEQPGSLMELGGKSLELLSELVKNGNQNRQISAPQTQTPVAQPVEPMQLEAENIMFFQMAIKNHLEFLVKQAESGRDVETYINYTLDQLPEKFYDELLKFLSGENPLQTVMELCPEISAHRSWFIQLIDGIKDELTPDQSEGDNSDHVHLAEQKSGDTAPID